MFPTTIALEYLYPGFRKPRFVQILTRLDSRKIVDGD
jgi:hypothetical protein